MIAILPKDTVVGAGVLGQEYGKIEWDKINYKSHFNNNKKH